MPRLIFLLMAPLLVGVVACAPHLKLRLTVPPPQQAEVEIRLTRGDTPASPGHCETPCTIEIAPDTQHQVIMTSPGYYPANFALSYDDVAYGTTVPFWGYCAGEKYPLVIPLIKRRAAADASAGLPRPGLPASRAHEPPAAGREDQHLKVEERLHQLERLRSQGLISEKEYQDIRSDILNDL